MSFDFGKLEKMSKKFKGNEVLEAIVLGTGGAGKSTLAGTIGGKVLYLYGQGERHGPVSAQSSGVSEIVPIGLDSYENPDQDPDKAIEIVESILGDVEGIKKAGFTAVVVDSLVEYEKIVRASKAFKVMCLNDKGKHNNFAEPAAVNAIFRGLFDRLRKLADEGIHYIVTAPVNVTGRDEEDGSVLEANPRLSTYSVVESTILQMPEVLLIGQMTKNSKVAHRLQFSGSVSRVSKDASGNIKKYLNFNPRITGVRDLPETMPADLQKVLELKKNRGTKESK